MDAAQIPRKRINRTLRQIVRNIAYGTKFQEMKTEKETAILNVLSVI